MFSESTGKVVVVRKRHLGGKLFIEYDNYLHPQIGVIQEFDSINEARKSFPDAICLIRK